MVSAATLAAFRYGYGPRPDGAKVRDAAGLLASLPDAGLPFTDDWDTRSAIFEMIRQARRDRDRGVDGSMQRSRSANRAFAQYLRRDQRRAVQAAMASPTGFDQRLLAFWIDHFTAAQTFPRLSLALPHMHATAIGPHITGRFKDMLRAVITHPAMVMYLDQGRSFGPNSPAGLERGRGLNENLARELLELHTLGVDAGYTQTDVRELAELLTGLAHGPDGYAFYRGRVEPGPETVMGRTYHSDRPGIEPIAQVLDDLAAHPETAHHLARKLVVHFLGAPAPRDLVADMADAYLAADTRLTALYDVMLHDTRAWHPRAVKARTPFEFVVASLRAAGTDPAQLSGLRPREVNRDFLQPLAQMGQPLWRPQGPDGWPEAPEAWITPVGLSARLRWSDGFAKRMLGGSDPRDFLDTAVGDAASPTLRFAVAGAEDRIEGHVIVLASPEFNRR